MSCFKEKDKKFVPIIYCTTKYVKTKRSNICIAELSRHGCMANHGSHPCQIWVIKMHSRLSINLIYDWLVYSQWTCIKTIKLSFPVPSWNTNTWQGVFCGLHIFRSYHRFSIIFNWLWIGHSGTQISPVKLICGSRFPSGICMYLAQSICLWCQKAFQLMLLKKRHLKKWILGGRGYVLSCWALFSDVLSGTAGETSLPKNLFW